MMRYGDGFEELFFKGQAAANPGKRVIGQESVIKSRASPDAITGFIESQSGDDDQFDAGDWEGLVGGGVSQAKAAYFHFAIEGFDHHGDEFSILPDHFRDQDLFAGVKGLEDRCGGIDFPGQREVYHDHLSVLEFIQFAQVFAGLGAFLLDITVAQGVEAIGNLLPDHFFRHNL